MRLILLLLCVPVLICRAEEPGSGRWEGSVQIPGKELKLIVDLANEGTAGWSGSVIMPGMGVKGARLTDITFNASGFSSSIKDALAGQGGAPPKLEGRLAENGALTGEFTQGGNKAPFTLIKTGVAQVESLPRSTAIAKEIEGEWKGEYSLLGYPRKVSLKLMNRAADGAGAEFVIVGKKVNNLPVNRVSQEGDLVMVDSLETGITYEGRAKGDQIVGTFFQGPIELPLVLKRAK